MSTDIWKELEGCILCSVNAVVVDLIGHLTIYCQTIYTIIPAKKRIQLPLWRLHNYMRTPYCITSG
jgi:hypothetical protein